MSCFHSVWWTVCSGNTQYYKQNENPQRHLIKKKGRFYGKYSENIFWGNPTWEDEKNILFLQYFSENLTTIYRPVEMKRRREPEQTKLLVDQNPGTLKIHKVKEFIAALF